MSGKPNWPDAAVIGGNEQGRGPTLRARWLGRVPYHEAWDLQQRLFVGDDNHLLLLEHPPVYTLGRSGDEANVVADPKAVGAELIRVNRGGDVTFHGPGQIVGYPILGVAGRRGGGLADTAAYVHSVEALLIDVLARLGLDGHRLDGRPGVWIDPGGPNARKIAAIGVRLSRGRSMHGFALNVDVDLDWFSTIVPCGIVDKGVTSLRAEGVDANRAEIVDLLVDAAARHLMPSTDQPGSDQPGSKQQGRDRRPIVERNDVVFDPDAVELSAFTRHGADGTGAGAPSVRELDVSKASTVSTSSTAVPVRLRRRMDQVGLGDGLDVAERKPSWMRVKLETGPEFLAMKARSRDLGLTTVCEEAGCPNIFECWNEGTATFMLLGERCTRACGFCLVDTSKPLAVDQGEPDRVAEAVEHMAIDHAVLTMVARDDLDDGGASIVARTVEAIRARCPDTAVEVLISDLKGSAAALEVVCASRPAVLNHNIETVARLQRLVRPSAGYARSLTVLARADAAGLLTKSGLIVGMGETMGEVRATLADLAAVGVDIVTVGQYLRPTARHLPVDRWWTPEEFDEIKQIGELELGLAEVVASPLTRSSHHAGVAAARVRSRDPASKDEARRDVALNGDSLAAATRDFR